MGNLLYTHVSAKTGKTYTLHQRTQKLKGGQAVKLFFFSLTAKTNGSGDPLTDLPEGYEVTENKKTGLPLLKRKSA